MTARPEATDPPQPPDPPGAVAPTEAAVRAALRRVPEPCGLLMREPIDICAMGLVEAVAVAGGRVRVELVLTDPSCVHFTGLRRYITDVLLELPGVTEVEVAISTTVLWTPDRQHPPSAPPPGLARHRA